MAKGRGFVEGHDENIGRGEHANMPKEVRMEAYPRARMGREGEIDDTMSRIDSEIDQSVGQRDRHRSNQH